MKSNREGSQQQLRTQNGPAPRRRRGTLMRARVTATMNRINSGPHATCLQTKSTRTFTSSKTGTRCHKSFRHTETTDANAFPCCRPAEVLHDFRIGVSPISGQKNRGSRRVNRNKAKCCCDIGEKLLFVSHVNYRGLHMFIDNSNNGWLVRDGPPASIVCLHVGTLVPAKS